ncbi:MAG: Vgb family protein [Ktedonobacteraceae bacterium]
MRRFFFPCLFAFILLAGSLLLIFNMAGNPVKSAFASGVTAQDYYVPSGTDPWGTAIDSNGHVWLAIPGCDPAPTCSSTTPPGKIAEFNPSNSSWLNMYTLPVGYAQPLFLVFDGQGRLWFTMPTDDSIGMYNPGNNTFQQWTVPTANAGPWDIAIDHNGKLWFTEFYSNKIGRFDPNTQTFMEVSTPASNSYPYGIVVDGSNNVWFTENNSTVALIGEYTSGGQLDEYKIRYSLPSNLTPHLITVDPNGNIWWSEGWVGMIAELKVAQASPGTNNGVTEYAYQKVCTTCEDHTSGISVDSNGLVWFDDAEQGIFGSFPDSGTGSFTTYNAPSANSHPHDGLIVDGQNRIWFSEEFSNKLAVAIQSGVPTPTPTSTTGTTPTPTQTTSPTTTPTPPPVTGPVSKIWYFAEGRVGHGFDEFLTLGNPTGNDCQVNITYLTQPDSGLPGTTTVSFKVLASTRVTRWVDSDLGTTRAGHGISVAATVSVDTVTTPNCSGIVAERPMYFNAQAQGTNSGSDVLGVTHTGTTFYFADMDVGSQPGGGNYSSYLPILNPGTTAANVTATYYAGGKTVGTQTLAVAANSRGTIFPSQAVPALPSRVSVVLTSSQPVVSERPTYFSGIAGGNAGIVSGAADVIGVQQLANDWLFAEGYTGGRFQENFVLANLDPANKPANVTITLEYNGGTSKTFTVTVNPLSQVVWNVNANSTGTGTSQSVSAEITSSGAQIAVEREMFFGYSHTGNGRTMQATGGTDVLGQVGPAANSDYSFAEGYTNLGYDEWLTIQNPTATTETVNVTVSNGVGTVYTFAEQVVGHSRSTVDMVAIVQQHVFHGGNGYQGYEISMALQSSSGPFVVERPMYWNASGTQGGSDVIGYSGG